ncbi:MAG: hypothetical protein QM802_11730 [Agriterribacter sp.]
MKLSEAIAFATSHKSFVNFLATRNINPDSAHHITVKVTNLKPNIVEHRLHIDFGDPGQSSDDVRVIVDYIKSSGKFEFIQADFPPRIR